VSVVSFDPNTMAPSISSIRPEFRIGREPLPERLGRYEIVKKLGQGGMGSVYLARDVQLDRQVALKVIEGIREVGGPKGRFQREARAVARLDHPGIMRIYDFGEQDGVVYLTLEYVRGGSLSKLLREEGPMELERAVRLVLELAQAVHAAHENGIIHRDLKPSNVLLTEIGTPKISDFGLAKLVGQINEDQAETHTGQPLGTPGYMAPEQVRGELDKIGPATDVYGLGTILYECLTGRRPFQGGSLSVAYQIVEQMPAPPRQVRPEIPVSLEQICLKCLDKDPRKRYAGANQLAVALYQFLAGEAAAETAKNERDGKEQRRDDEQVTPAVRVEQSEPNTRRGLWVRVWGWFIHK
jgi:serine/threonine protein kinase